MSDHSVRVPDERWVSVGAQWLPPVSKRPGALGVTFTDVDVSSVGAELVPLSPTEITRSRTDPSWKPVRYHRRDMKIKAGTLVFMLANPTGAWDECVFVTSGDARVFQCDPRWFGRLVGGLAPGWVAP